MKPEHCRSDQITPVLPETPGVPPDSCLCMDHSPRQESVRESAVGDRLVRPLKSTDLTVHLCKVHPREACPHGPGHCRSPHRPLEVWQIDSHRSPSQVPMSLSHGWPVPSLDGSFPCGQATASSVAEVLLGRVSHWTLGNSTGSWCSPRLCCLANGTFSLRSPRSPHAGQMHCGYHQSSVGARPVWLRG